MLRSRIENRLQDHFDGKKRLTPTQLKAGELLYARLRPVLSAVEQTVTDARDTLSEDQLLAQLCALFAAKPDLYERVVRIQQASALVAESESAVASAQQGAVPACYALEQRASELASGTAPARAPAQEPVGVEPPRKNA
jgi:hypothetical protein